MPNEPVMVERRCVTCEKTFMAKKWNVDTGGGRYCSNRCRIKSQRQMGSMRVGLREAP